MIKFKFISTVWSLEHPDFFALNLTYTSLIQCVICSLENIPIPMNSQCLIDLFLIKCLKCSLENILIDMVLPSMKRIYKKPECLEDQSVDMNLAMCSTMLYERMKAHFPIPNQYSICRQWVCNAADFHQRER